MGVKCGIIHSHRDLSTAPCSSGGEETPRAHPGETAGWGGHMTTPETVAPNRFADMFGYPKGRAVTKLKNYMTPFVQEFIQHAPFAVLATSDRDGRCDASPKGGKPGFVRVLDERHLLLPD